MSLHRTLQTINCLHLSRKKQLLRPISYFLKRYTRGELAWFVRNELVNIEYTGTCTESRKMHTDLDLEGLVIRVVVLPEKYPGALFIKRYHCDTPSTGTVLGNNNSNGYCAFPIHHLRH